MFLIRDCLLLLLKHLQRGLLRALIALFGMSIAATTSAQTLADSFSPNANNFAQSLAVQADGKLLVGGAFTTMDGTSQVNLARLTADGWLDTTFRTGLVTGVVFSVVELPSGKILIGGNFTEIRSVPQAGSTSVMRNGIAQLNADGSVDTAFNPGAVANGGQGNVFRILPVASGKLLVGGHFTNIGGSGRSKLARLNADGTVDTSFNAVAMNAGDYVWNFAEQADGKLLVSGGFTQIGGFARNNVVRLEANGAVDPSFVANATYSTTAYPSVNTTLLQSDGKIVITGQFDRVNGLARTNLARLNSNGSVDTTYSTANATNAGIHWGLTQPDGKLVIGGSFTTVGGTARAKLARLNSDGTLDSTFADQLVTGGDIYTLARQPDGKTIAGGTFTHVNGQSRPRLARFYGKGLIEVTESYQQVAVGGNHTCALTSSSAVQCWGRNYHGRLGDGSFIDRPLRATVTGLSSGVQSVSAGGFHTCAVSAEGLVKCWGLNNSGQIGDGTTTDRAEPVVVAGLPAAATTVTAGDSHSCALLVTGAVYCWGSNLNGQIGDGTTNNRLSPTAVVSMGNGFKAVSAGERHSCAVTLAGAARCWGSNDFGQLGDGTSINRLTPVAVSGLGSGVATVTGGYDNSCALTLAGAARCWGKNSNGELGDGTTVQRLTSVAVSGMGSGVLSMVGGGSHNCAVTAAGASWCWGDNFYGQLGDGTTIDRLTPVVVSSLGSGTVVVGVGGYHSCALSSPGFLQCWGHNIFGQLGDGTSRNRSVPVALQRYAFIVTPVAGSGGTISAALPQTIDAGTRGSFTVTPNPNYHVLSVGGTCGGTLSGNVYTTDIIGVDCTVSATFGINTWTVTPSAVGGHGSITPATPQTINGGSTASFTLVPEAGYLPSVSGTCGGTLNGNNYVTSAITANCTVIASFTLDTRTVTPSVVGGHGAITPATVQTVNYGATASFTLAPEAGYLPAVSGTCGGGGLVGNLYTTNPITSNCTVIASFTLDTRTVTPSVVGGHGTITPATAQTVNYGTTTSFTLTPEAGYLPAVTGTCGGTLTGNNYVTTAITTNCTVVANFASVQASLSITNNRTYSRYGMTLNYLVTLLNSGATDLTGTLSSLLPSQLDSAATTWICVEPGVGVQCSASGGGSLNDNVVVPAGRSVSWLVSAPVRMNANEPSIDYSVSFGSALLPAPISAADHDTLVLFRHGWDREYDDGSEASASIEASSALDWNGDAAIVFAPIDSTSTSVGPIEVLLSAVTMMPPAVMTDATVTDGIGPGSLSTSQRVRVERLTSIARSWLRLVSIASDGAEQHGRWLPSDSDAVLHLRLQHDDDASYWLLIGAIEPLTMPLRTSTAPND